MRWPGFRGAVMSAPSRKGQPVLDRADRLTGVVTALPEELAPLLHRASAVRKIRAGRRCFYQATMGQAGVVMTRTGDGWSNAEQGVEALLERFPVTGLIGAGVAGALSPGLQVGDLLVARSVFKALEPAPSPEPSWLARATGTIAGAQAATLVSFDEILCSAERKATLWSRLRQNGSAALDMESAAWAHVAGRRGTPYLIVRAVLDRAEEDLPEFLTNCLFPWGGLNRAKVARHALRHPGVVGDLLALRRRVRFCAERLADFVERFLNAPS